MAAAAAEVIVFGVAYCVSVGDSEAVVLPVLATASVAVALVAAVVVATAPVIFQQRPPCCAEPTLASATATAIAERKPSYPARATGSEAMSAARRHS